MAKFYLPRNQLGYLLVIPCLMVVLGILLYPLVVTAYYSFLRMGPLANNFVGLKNYARIFSDSAFWLGLNRTLYFTGCSVAIQLILGFSIALLINKVGIFVAIIRTLSFIPWAMAITVTALLWKFMLNPVFGVVSLLSNGFLLRLGIVSQPINWVGDYGMEMVIFIDTWQSTPFVLLFCLAGLQTIPQELYEAAKIDGANYLQRVRSITLPLLKPTLLVVVLFRTLWALRIFALPWTLTGGEGAFGEMEVLSMRAYRFMFSYMMVGRGSAEVLVLAAISIMLCYFFIRSVLKDL